MARSHTYEICRSRPAACRIIAVFLHVEDCQRQHLQTGCGLHKMRFDKGFWIDRRSHRNAGPTIHPRNLDAVKANCANRNVKADVDRVVAARRRTRTPRPARRRRIQQRQNEVSKLIPKEKDAAKKQAADRRGQGACANRSAGWKSRSKQVEADLRRRSADHPQHDAPRRPGRHRRRRTTRSSRTWGEPRKFDFKPKDHVALAEALDLVDFEAGASVAGQKFYFLKNEAVLLELALVQYAMQTLVEAGLHAGHHAGPGPRRGAGGHRLHSARPRPGDAADLHASPTPTCA